MFRREFIKSAMSFLGLAPLAPRVLGGVGEATQEAALPPTATEPDNLIRLDEGGKQLCWHFSKEVGPQRSVVGRIINESPRHPIHIFEVTISTGWGGNAWHPTNVTFWLEGRIDRKLRIGQCCTALFTTGPATPIVIPPGGKLTLIAGSRSPNDITIYAAGRLA